MKRKLDAFLHRNWENGRVDLLESDSSEDSTELFIMADVTFILSCPYDSESCRSEQFLFCPQFPTFLPAAIKSAAAKTGKMDVTRIWGINLCLLRRKWPNFCRHTRNNLVLRNHNLSMKTLPPECNLFFKSKVKITYFFQQ